MHAENWKKVKELLNEVLELENFEQRQSFLDESNADAEIRAEVESLLGFEIEAKEAMRLSAVEFSKDFFGGDAFSSPIGQRIGNYTIVRELGYGGMGAVYLAERSDGKFEQRVALKFLKRELNTSALRRRFEREREILATLEYPSIARLLDAGTTRDDVPYIAMEYVEGIPIDDFCRANNLELNERLDLFRKICATVGYAHRSLVVHRDLKPSNILVTEDGSPKLLDFGISKILSSEFEQMDSATVTKLGAMTPAYASPEQLQNKSVTTATDVYSLGVILYELLSGHRPFESKENDFKEIHRAVLEEQPAPPSEIARTVSKNFREKTGTEAKIKSSDESATKRFSSDTEANKVNNTLSQTMNFSSNSLRGDLDNIVLKALRKEPERRYSSAESFAEDIERHQDGLPVAARPNTLAYRAEKFVKRNRFAVAAAFVILLTVGGGIIATLWQAKRAEAQRVRAENRFAQVRTLANSFLFEFSPKIENLPGSIPARQLLVTRALEYLDNLSLELSDDAELQKELATAYEKVGDVQGNPFNPNIGDVKGALESYEKAEQIRRKLGEKNPGDAQTLDALANNFKLQGNLHTQGGDYKKAGDFYARALEIQEKIVEKNPRDFNFRWNLADIMRYNGYIEYLNERHKVAIELYSRAIEIYEQIVPQQPENFRLARNYADVLVSMGESQGWDGDYKGGGANLQKGLDMLVLLREKDLNDRHLQRALVIAYGKRGENLVDLEDYEKADECYSKSIELAKNISASDPQDKQARRDVAMQYKKRATAFNARGESESGIENMTFALGIFQELADADPNNTESRYDIANARRIIGLTYLTMKEYEKALEVSRLAVEEFNSALAANPNKDYIKVGYAFAFKSIGRSYLGLAEKGNRQENLQKAVENLQVALDMLKAVNEAGTLNQSDISNLETLDKQIAETKSKIGKS